MVRILLIVALLASCPSLAFDDGYRWSKQQLVGFVFLACSGLAIAAHSTDSSSFGCTDPYYLSDQDTTTYTWFQIYAGIFAVVLIGSNFASAWYFYEISQRDLSHLLSKQIAEAREENKKLRRDGKTINGMLARIQKELGVTNESN